MALISLLQNVWWLLVLIGVMILIHELGHFWAARAFDVKVEVFSFGFGPRLFGFRRGETDYRFSLILFGGYVRMTGEQPGDPNSQDPRSILNKPPSKRLIVAAARPYKNEVQAVAVLAGLYMVDYEKIVDDGGAVIGHVIPDSPAAKVGIVPGDKIVRLNGKNDPDWEDIITTEVESAERPITITIERAGHLIPLSVTPILDDKLGFGSAGWEGQNTIQVGGVTPGMPAAVAGFQKGDLLVRINNMPIHSRYTLPDAIRKSDGKPVTIEYVRNGAHQVVTLLPVFKNPDGTARWMIGVQTDTKLDIQKTQAGVSGCVAGVDGSKTAKTPA